MAEVVDDIIKTLNETNGTDTESVLKNLPVTAEGMLIAYTGLVVMALVAIFFGSLENYLKTTEKNKMKNLIPEFMTKKDAMMFPFIASDALFSLYIFSEVNNSREHINLSVSLYFFVLGQTALCHTLRDLLPKSIPETKYQLQFTEGTGKKKI